MTLFLRNYPTESAEILKAYSLYIFTYFNKYFLKFAVIIILRLLVKITKFIKIKKIHYKINKFQITKSFFKTTYISEKTCVKHFNGVSCIVLKIKGH